MSYMRQEKLMRHLRSDERHRRSPGEVDKLMAPVIPLFISKDAHAVAMEGVKDRMSQKRLLRGNRFRSEQPAAHRKRDVHPRSTAESKHLKALKGAANKAEDRMRERGSFPFPGISRTAPREDVQLDQRKSRERTEGKRR